MRDRWLLYSKVCAAEQSPHLGINPKSKGEAWSPTQCCSSSVSQAESKEHVVLLLTSYYRSAFTWAKVSGCLHKQQKAARYQSLGVSFRTQSTKESKGEAVIKELGMGSPFTGSIFGAVPRYPAVVWDGHTLPSKAGTHRALGQSSLHYMALWGCRYCTRWWHCFSGLSKPLLRDAEPTITVIVSALDVYLRTSLCYMLHNPWWKPGPCNAPLRTGSRSIADSPNSNKAAGPWQQPYGEKTLWLSELQREARRFHRENKTCQYCFNLYTDIRQDGRASSLSAREVPG